MDDRVSHISSVFYSALQALCFMFPIAPPEINQSNTCSRPLGWWRPSTSLPVPRITAVRSLSKGMSWLTCLIMREYHPSCFVLCFFVLSLFPFPSSNLSFVFWVWTPLLMWEWPLEHLYTQPSTVCVCMHTYVGPGPGVGYESCLDPRGLHVENGGFQLQEKWLGECLANCLLWLHLEAEPRELRLELAVVLG